MLGKKSVSFYLLAYLVVFFSGFTHAASKEEGEGYDESRLWLPLKYERYYLKLKKATQSAFELDRCVKVLESTIDLEKSTSYAPFFKVLCRQPNGKTYIEIVDGTTFQPLTTVKDDDATIRLWFQQCFLRVQPCLAQVKTPAR